jgi:hypothetical protein
MMAHHLAALSSLTMRPQADAYLTRAEGWLLREFFDRLYR